MMAHHDDDDDHCEAQLLLQQDRKDDIQRREQSPRFFHQSCPRRRRSYILNHDVGRLTTTSISSSTSSMTSGSSSLTLLHVFNCRWFWSNSFIATFWFFLLHHQPRLLLAEDTSSNYYSKNNNSGNNNNNNSNKGYHDVQAFCRRNLIRVTAVYITCDTPGAYYYGGNAYRNSEVCMSGDKVNLRIMFTISEDLNDQPKLQVESGMYDKFQTVITSSSLCQLPVSSVENQNEECPMTGRYQLKTYYTMPSIRDYSFHYTPDLKLTFTSADGSQRLGCATTGTVALRRYHDQRATHGLIALAISVVAFCIIFGLLIYLSYRRKKRLEKLAEKRSQGFQYFRTLPSGQVVNLSTTSRNAAMSSTSSSMNKKTMVVSAMPSHDGSDDALGISNPSYNEPQIPTRPLI